MLASEAGVHVWKKHSFGWLCMRAEQFACRCIYILWSMWWCCCACWDVILALRFFTWSFLLWDIVRHDFLISHMCNVTRRLPIIKMCRWWLLAALTRGPLELLVVVTKRVTMKHHFLHLCHSHLSSSAPNFLELKGIWRTCSETCRQKFATLLTTPAMGSLRKLKESINIAASRISWIPGRRYSRKQ